MKQLVIGIFLLLVFQCSHAEVQLDKNYFPSIAGVKLFAGSQLSYPIMSIGATNALELHFDDLDGIIKNYSYTFLLCDADWQPADMSPFDYIRGFQTNRISQYRVASVATTRYIHYTVYLPERNAVPVKSGNYILKVFLNGDTSKLAFTRRFLVVDNIVPIGAQVVQPFDVMQSRTMQKVQFTIDKKQLNIFNTPQQLKVAVLQNFRWDNAVTDKQPMFMRGDMYEYNGERDFLFPAGKEYRWADLRSFRFQSDRVDHVNMNTQPFEVWLKPDAERTKLGYIYYEDYNGFFEVNSTESINPWWQGDYARVHFTYVPSGNQPLAGKDVYVVGQMNNYETNDSSKLVYNAEKGVYEKSMLLKQAYYSYMYVTKDAGAKDAVPSMDLTEGNYWETENNYVVLVYYRAMGDRYDQLVGLVMLNSRLNRR